MKLTLVASLVAALLAPAPAQAVSVDQMYHQTWNQASKYFGAHGLPAPNYVVTDEPYPGPTVGVQAWTDEASDGSKIVKITPRVAHWMVLAYKPQAKGWKNHGYFTARLDIIHEWAHVYQNEEVWSHNLEREGGAETFSKLVMKAVYGRGYGSWHSDAQKAFDALYGPEAWGYEQFSQYWGQDPREIPYP